MPKVTLEINQASGLKDSFEIRSPSGRRDLQIRAGREQEVSVGREFSILLSLERVARLYYTVTSD